MGKELYQEGFTQNRELSWLRFNERVLEEALDEKVPLLERLKFVSIFTSNLDEFFMIRVGSLFDLHLLDPTAVDKKSGFLPSEQLFQMYQEVGRLIQKRESVLGQVETKLREKGIFPLGFEELEPSEQRYVRDYFKQTIQPILSPQIVDAHHPFPHFLNKNSYVGLMLRHKGKDLFGVVPIPMTLPEIVYLPGEAVRYIHLHHIVERFAPSLFEVYQAREVTSFCVTRNADIHSDEVSLEDSFEELDGKKQDFRKKMKKLLGKRRKMAAVRLELSKEISSKFRGYLCEKLDLKEMQVYCSSAPFTMKYAFSIEKRPSLKQREKLVFAPFTPQHTALSMKESIFSQVRKKDVLLSYPYESMDGFLAFVKEASVDSQVMSIKITIYRLSNHSKLVEYLRAAVDNNKEVTVVIELRARFDEQSNIDYSEELEEAGCSVIYGFEGYKVHSKICLVTLLKDGQVQYLTNIATGNYNENTAKLYGDLSLLTADQAIGKDANEFFNNMAIGSHQGHYEKLLVAPLGLKSKLLSLIEEEIQKGKEGKIVMKANSLTDADIIKKLSAASIAGVEVQLIIRGICCLLPGMEGKTEHVKVRSIVGRFLEHSRIYCFGEGDRQQIYISSADLMTRNTEKRVEIGCPITDGEVRERINHLLELQLQDNVKARYLDKEGRYQRVADGKAPMNSQKTQMEEAVAWAQKNELKQREQMEKFARRLLEEKQAVDHKKLSELKKKEELHRIRQRQEAQRKPKGSLLGKLLSWMSKK